RARVRRGDARARLRLRPHGARHHAAADGASRGAVPIDGLSRGAAIPGRADAGRALPGASAAMSFRTLWFEDGALHLLDQRRLPARAEIVAVRSARATAEAIREMVVRGAPAIGCAAAYGMALAARAGEDFETARQALLESRPTAVNLRWAVERLWRVQPRTFEALKAEADRVLAEDLAACKAIGRNGAALVPDGKGILTHCNAGGLATAGYGTALGVVRAALEAGKKCAVFADETRPWLQGARLTAWELLQDGIPVTLLPDVAAASLLSSGRIGCVVVGADRIACNG